MLVAVRDGDRVAMLDKALAELGGKRVMETGHGQLYGFAQGPLFGITAPYNGQEQHCGNENPDRRQQTHDCLR